MLNHKFVTAIFGLLILTLLLIDNIVYELPIGLFYFPFPIYLGIIIWGSADISSNYHIQILCDAPKNSANEIAISFDDGPHAKITPEVLDILKKSGTTATFFCIGKNVNENPTLVKRIVDEGHTLGNHTFSHSYFFDFWNSEKISNDLTQTTNLLLAFGGKQTKLFRPPYGVTTPAIAESVKKLDMTVIGWSIRSLDTVQKNEDKIMKTISRKLRPGSIILFHDRLPTTCSLLEKTIKLCNEKGYKIVALDKLLSINAYE
jgi:peptidoglycan/xylan/chitin deacetylase (PgdA/CDA1 family)